MKTINILTGPVRSGKTTRLIAWIRYHQNSAGILSPVINNKRHLFSIKANESHCLEAEPGSYDDSEVIKIGRYVFLQSTFNWARKQLKEAARDRPRWLVIDEIGPLELAQHGLEPVLSEIIHEYPRSDKNRLVIVVRNTLFEVVIQHYQLEGQFETDQDFLNTG